MSSMRFFMFSKLLCIFAASFSLFCTVDAQTEQRTLGFSAISFNEMPNDLWYESAGKLVELKTGGSVRGPQLSYAGDPLIEFFKRVPDGAGGFKKVLQAQIVIPDEINEALLCFFASSADEASGLPWNVYVMDDSLESFGAGDIRFVNLTASSIAGVLDDETIRLQPGQLETIAPEVNKKNGFGVKLAAYLGEQWEPFFSARWQHRKKVRLMILFLSNDETEKVTMKAVPQSVRNAG